MWERKVLAFFRNAGIRRKASLGQRIFYHFGMCLVYDRYAIRRNSVRQLHKYEMKKEASNRDINVPANCISLVVGSGRAEKTSEAPCLGSCSQWLTGGERSRDPRRKGISPSQSDDP